MNDKARIAAEEYFGNFNCTQSVIAMFAEDYGLDKETALRMGAGFGGGCQFGGTCGAVTGGVMAISLKHGNSVTDKAVYAKCREKTREFMNIFNDKYESTYCSELLGIDMEDEGGRDRARAMGLFDTQCREYVSFVVATLEELGY